MKKILLVLGLANLLSNGAASSFAQDLGTPPPNPPVQTIPVPPGTKPNSLLNQNTEIKKENGEMVLEVHAKKKSLHPAASTSSTEIDKSDIEKLPEGTQESLPHLLATTTPGVISGPFGQTFIRGNHANIQYQIDGIQLPESPSNTFGDIFSPRNIDRMEVITGGLPAEYGERDAAVVNIATKSGPETPGGEAEVNYGSYNRFSPQAMFGGSNESGSFHYYVSANYNQTDRGLDTPQPTSEQDESQGGTDAVHDFSQNTSQFVKLDLLPENSDKFSLVLFNSYSFFQIPNFPSNFNATDPFFSTTYADPFGNVGGNVFIPYNDDDRQTEWEDYAQAFWKHTFSTKTFLQLAPYWKYSSIRFDNDPLYDLNPLNPNSASFFEDRHVNNMGFKADLSTRPNDWNLVKTGLLLQGSRSEGTISVQTLTTYSEDSSPDNGYLEAAYAQDEMTIFKDLVLNAGLRFSATQFIFAGDQSSDWLIQPRIGLSYMATKTTKLHIYYGRLYQPAPVENLRDTFVNSGAGQLSPYDIKSEKDHYFEAGVAQNVWDKQIVSLTGYYKLATNMLDDTELLTTPIAQPYNFATGYAYGVELSMQGQLNDEFSDFVNYSYDIAKGRGISGGIFAFAPGTTPDAANYQFLDHVQIHTVNSGFTFTKYGFWGTVQGLYGSGLRTGPNNSVSLPDHFTMDLGAGYELHGKSWLSQLKFSANVTNIFDNVYPITISNGFNGSHYAAGREFFVRVIKIL